MASTPTRQIKVLLLVAGYLFMVLNHIYFVKPGEWVLGSIIVKEAGHTGNSDDGGELSSIAVKRIFKTTLNRKAFNKAAKAPQQLYTATLLHPVGPSAIDSQKTVIQYTTVAKLRAQRFFYLRI